MAEAPRFAFGANWSDFAARALDAQAYAAAREHIESFLPHVGSRASFLDVGCGSGLFMMAALECGFERVRGFDYDPDSVATTRRLIAEAGAGAVASVERGDVLDRDYLAGLGRHPVVYAWGSLHHTGDMWRAIENAIGLVEPGGLLVAALYNRTWSSPVWRQIKRAYVHSGPRVRRALVGGVYVVGATARAVYTRTNPFRRRRGMSFRHDIVDWVGGYPYEYATPDEVGRFAESRGLTLLETRRGSTPIACNEFLLRAPSR
jgi:2-polyprenyl-6-hydroxyphenyl methylase/3-demethylubiquinone-9 3-methyltransferase